MQHTEIDNIGLLANYLKVEKSILDSIYKNGYDVIQIGSDTSGKGDLTYSIKRYLIPKKKGVRSVYSPYSDTLINCLKILNTNLSKLYSPPDCVHGFVKGRNIKSNAIPHLGKMYVYQFDIENYFESIDSEKVVNSLEKIGFTQNASQLISSVVCHNGSLVQGFHTSPTVANIVFRDLDEIFKDIGEHIDYSRYADDLYFSSEIELDIYEQIKLILKKFGFSLNVDKCKLMKRGESQYVTGLTVFDNVTPRISKRKKKQLRQQIYYIKKYGYKGHIFHKLKVSKKEYENNPLTKERVDHEMKRVYAQVNGWLLFVNSIEPDFSQKYLEILRSKP